MAVHHHHRYRPQCHQPSTITTITLLLLLSASSFATSSLSRLGNGFENQEGRDQKNQNQEERITTNSTSASSGRVWSLSNRALLNQKRLGSMPPSCRSKCGNCSPCTPVHVPIQPGTSFPLEYYPEAWRCKCGNKLFMP